MNRVVLGLLLASSASLFACGGSIVADSSAGPDAATTSTTTTTGDDARDDAGRGSRSGDAAPGDDATTIPDAAACTTIAAVNYDQPCTTAADCVATVVGGDTCDPCDSPEVFTCATAAINVNAKATYEAAIAASLGVAPGIRFTNDECGGGVSCPIAGIPMCTDHACVLVYPSPPPPP